MTKITEIKINWGCICAKCGASEATISSTASGALKHGWFHDGDEVKCVECGNTGEMDARGEDSNICWNEDEDLNQTDTLPKSVVESLKEVP